MNYNIATILAVIAILFVLLTYVTGAPLAYHVRSRGAFPFYALLRGLAIGISSRRCCSCSKSED